MTNSKKHWLLHLRPAFVASFLKKVLRIKRRVIQTDQGRFFIDPASNFGNAIASDGVYEPDMSNALTHLLKEGDVFLDIGANEGCFSIVASKLVGATGRVISIEPQSRLQEVIFRNIAENEAFNITVFQVAISDSVGMAEISLLPDMNTGGSGLFQTTRYKTAKQIIPQTTLSQLLGLLKVEKIRLMKIDVEGFEYESILGSRDVFTSNLIENIALELHPAILARRQKSESEIVDFLLASGYTMNNEFGTLIMSRHVD
jgi:FkbM family methyltransferase